MILLSQNAGSASVGTPIEDLSLETFQSVINVNVIGTFLCTREAVRQFKKQTPPGGRIINNGYALNDLQGTLPNSHRRSISAHTPRPNSIPYTTSKHAVSGITKSTALDGRAFDISVTQIDIGAL